jgi:hypothetical protein
MKSKRYLYVIALRRFNLRESWKSGEGAAWLDWSGIWEFEDE